jgi:hypothetical protein
MKTLVGALLVIALLALPPLAPPYVLHVAIVVLINVAYAEALYTIMRMGYLSFGHAGYIALGAYTLAILATKFAVPVWIGFVAGGMVAALFGWLLGTITLKLRGIYFSLSVFAFGEVVNAVFARSTGSAARRASRASPGPGSSGPRSTRISASTTSSSAPRWSRSSSSTGCSGHGSASHSCRSRHATPKPSRSRLGSTPPARRRSRSSPPASSAG